MPDNSLTVYLDHLIERENLRYQRSEEKMGFGTQQKPDKLRIVDLMGDHMGSRIHLLRKPDFQRATWAWSPQDCVSLLESVINEQVIPSIIMWRSPDNGYDYVLDGAHRISVVMAWLTNDWGDKLSSTHYRDREQEERIRLAARQTRQLVAATTGDIDTYRLAEQQLDDVIKEGRVVPRTALDDATFKRGMAFRELRGGAGFHILWVTGDYEKAEQSFLKINKSGKQLSDWETKLVENRNSSFARAVMSLSNLTTARHYWPVRLPEDSDQAGLEQKVREIHENVERLHSILFQPPYRTPIVELKQPLLVAPEPQTKPFYLAEFLTVTERGKGQATETQRLIEKDKDATPSQLIRNGWELLYNALEVLEHLVGPSPRSLALAPALYFYNESGKYVRSLLYGMIYWLLSGTKEEILERKRVFSAYRAAFEQVLRERKEDVVTGITRKTGSGPEVTVQTAFYFQGLLGLLIQSNGNTESTEFTNGYADLAERLTTQKARFSTSAHKRRRQFSSKQKAIKVLQGLLSGSTRCDICGGLLDLTGGKQHDHIYEYAKGGDTIPENQRIVHPFCNNNRNIIESIQGGLRLIELPPIAEPNKDEQPQQLNFFNEFDFFKS